MWARRSAIRTWTTATLLLLGGWALSGCGDDGPTQTTVTSLSDLFGTQLYKADGSSVGIGPLEHVPLIGIYYASPGCSACGAFTPLLVDAYNQLRSDGRPFEVVLVASGIGKEALFTYMTDSAMPWLAIPPQSKKAESLVFRYDVRWVPTLVVIDTQLNTISLIGREQVARHGQAAYDTWLAASAGS